MKFSPLILTLFLIGSLNAQWFSKSKPVVLNLMPVPQHIELKSGAFRVTDDFSLGVTGRSHDRIYGGADRFLQRLSGRTVLFFAQGFLNEKTTPTEGKLIIRVQRPGEVKLGEDESYELTISSKGIVLEAHTDLGALHGLETLLQLLSVDGDGYYFPAIQINDHPQYPWRGLLIDVCRHWQPMAVIKRNLDGMAAVKLNVLHFHLSEDQGFRVESKVFPELTEKGSDGNYFTQTQIREIIQYADDRGIRVVPEFDMPGHTTALLTARPDLASGPGPYEIERKFGVFDPTIDPTRESTYVFMEKFWGEMAALFPDEYMHIGGDENNGKQWDANPRIQAFMDSMDLADNHALQRYFNTRLLEILTRNGKKMMGWDEIFQPDLPKNIVIQSWRGRKALIDAARQGYQGILSNGYYIDLCYPTDNHYLNYPIAPDADLTPDERARILGGEATMWAELVTPETIDSRIWPRTAAIAERLWSAPEVNDVDDMYRRLELVSFQLEELGLTHEKNHPMLLRRLRNHQDITALQTLVDVVEPVKGYTRHRFAKYTSFSPLTHVVDAARPDAAVARKFRKLVDAYLANPVEGITQTTIIQHLVRWESNHAKLKTTIAGSPILKEVESLSADLSRAATVGRDALAYLELGEAPDDVWIASSGVILENAKNPRAAMELMVISGIERLREFAISIRP
ncbi:MAG: family 20 glycosylhydrolase [Lentisphaeria bacterium]|nr:family 20 glycosylhydrolase [Candidatus Neomarinimicrobiota bacterium]MCF7841470.1 family 20 glycosylhydrolase [Lentisphaeria bacterium]